VIDHVSLNVGDFEASKRFYVEALAPLGYELVTEFGGRAAGFGRDGKPSFFIEDRGEPHTAVHVAFASPDRATVDRFHTAGLAAGGTDNGAPGLRWYHEHYYGAFVLDPDGNNVEAVCHRAE
jgi:catechol 2,3-dioxygenase-like lactoylglutathione lyase family enzyme